MLLILKGWHPEWGFQASIFTAGEEELAVHIARRWQERGWFPYLFAKTYDGEFETLHDFRRFERLAA